MPRTKLVFHVDLNHPSKGGVFTEDGLKIDNVQNVRYEGTPSGNTVYIVMTHLEMTDAPPKKPSKKKVKKVKKKLKKMHDDLAGR